MQKTLYLKQLSWNANKSKRNTPLKNSLLKRKKKKQR